MPVSIASGNIPAMIFLYAALSFGAGLALAAVVNWLDLLPWQRSQNAHWTERARQLFPARKASIINCWLVAANCAVFWQAFRGEKVGLWLLPTVAAWVGAAMAGYFSDRRIWPGLTFRRWFRQFIFYISVTQAGLVLMAIGIILMPAQFNLRAAIVAGVIFVLSLALTSGLTIVLLRAARVLKPAPARADELARRVISQTGAKVNRTWVQEGPMANAMVLLPMRDLVFSDSLLQMFSDEELASVCAHEAAHLTESKWVFLARLLGALLWYPMIFITPAITRFSLFGVLGLGAATFVMLLIYRRAARAMEKRADASAVAYAANPAVYARALEKLYEVNQIPAVMPKRAGAVHPDLYDRMLTAGVTPAYERPKPLQRKPWTAIALYFAFIIQLVVMFRHEKPGSSSGQKTVPDSSETIHLDAGSLTNPPPR